MTRFTRRDRSAGERSEHEAPHAGALPDVPAWADRRRDALTATVGSWIDDERLKLKPLPRLVIRTQSRVADLVARTILERHIDTAATDFGVEHFHSERVRYEASGLLFLRRGLRGRRVTRDDVFVDFGAGKGRVLYQAARRPFGRVIGVEISPKLSAIARENLDRNRGRLKCKDYEIVTADAATFELPDDVTIAYFYFPFAGGTFRAVLDNIVASLDRRPRRLRLVYACPKLADVVEATGRFRLVRVSRGGLLDFLPTRVAVWESVDPPATKEPGAP